MSSINEQIIFKRFSEDKSYRVIGNEIDRSRTFVMNEVNKYYILHPELKPIIEDKPPKQIIKGHRKTVNNEIGEVADILIDGYAARLTQRFINCGLPNCSKCYRDAAGKYEGHGPYKYLNFRDESGSVVTKYLTIPEQQSIANALLSGTKPINITIIDSKVTIVRGNK